MAQQNDVAVTAQSHEQPRCPVFGRCGGCQLQHLDYGQQLAHKRAAVLAALQRIGQLADSEVLPTLGMADPWRYRHHVQVPLRFEPRTRRYETGFFAPHSHDIVVTDVCHLETIAMETTLRRATEMLPGLLGADADALHHLVLRQSRATGEMALVLAVRRPVAAVAVAARELQAALPHVTGLFASVQARAGGQVLGANVDRLVGQPWLTERVAGFSFQLSPRSFFQVNPLQAELLVSLVRLRAEATRCRSLLDLYCGVGALTLPLAVAMPAGKTVGVDSVVPAIADARRNAQTNRVTAAEFHAAPAQRWIPAWVAAGGRADTVTVDPPRKGCDHAVLTAIAASGAERVVYVSCNHLTLARDLQRLVRLGFALQGVQPIDLFPQTDSIETVAWLSR